MEILYKLDAVPVTWANNAIYFIENGDYAETYVTSETGVPKKVGNSEMINALSGGSGVSDETAFFYAIMFG